MLQTLLNVFKIAELRNKVLFTLGMLAVFRIGHWIPIPGVNQAMLEDYMQSQTNSSAIGKVVDFVAMFSGGALSRSTIFGLGIMPYITAGIIFQLLGTVVPQLKALQEEGPTGRQKIMEWTRYATVVLCLVQGGGWLVFMSQQRLVYPEWSANPLWWVMAAMCVTAGTMFLMWLGEQIDRHGIGNGVSMIIMAGILTGMPGAIMNVVRNFDPSNAQKLGWPAVLLLLAGFVLVVSGAVLMTVAQRRIPIQQAKHTKGRKVIGGQKSYLPLRINHGGVMPIIFASSLMIFPSVIFSQIDTMIQGNPGWSGGWLEATTRFLRSNFDQGAYLYVIVYIIVVYFFSYFWITVQFNPEDMSKQLKEHGSFIPGLRPGPRTAEYLETVMSRLTFVGAGFLAVLAILPTVINKAMHVDFTVTQFLGGTGLLIVVSVTMDFLQRVEANLLMRNYSGFLGGDDGKGPKLKGPRF
ncbi:MAG: preprotein translocase subunit SecY [Phycisphaerales bacterium]